MPKKVAFTLFLHICLALRWKHLDRHEWRCLPTKRDRLSLRWSAWNCTFAQPAVHRSTNSLIVYVKYLRMSCGTALQGKNVFQSHLQTLHCMA